MRAFFSAELLFVLSVSAITQFGLTVAAADHAFDSDKRVPRTNSRIKGTPDPPPPYRTTVAFPHLKFEEPLAMTSAPGTNKLFVGRDGARPQIWAYGLRQPWKFSFDRASGDLWAGNVGHDLWEQIFLIERGGNDGWSVMEGSQPFRPERPRGPSPFISPIVEHDHAEFRSITGGFVYRGSRLPELKGAYIYG